LRFIDVETKSHYRKNVLVKQFVRATVRWSDRLKGEAVIPKVRKALLMYQKPCGCDDSGHIVPKEYGGKGDLSNLFLQNSNVNLFTFILARHKLNRFAVEPRILAENYKLYWSMVKK
jgi:hypothetical protein